MGEYLLTHRLTTTSAQMTDRIDRQNTLYSQSVADVNRIALGLSKIMIGQIDVCDAGRLESTAQLPHLWRPNASIIVVIIIIIVQLMNWLAAVQMLFTH